MEAVYSVPYSLLVCPNLKLKRPSWLRQPTAMTMFAFVLGSYFLVTGGMILSSPEIPLSFNGIYKVAVAVQDSSVV
jgi:hypothetical protein